MTNQTSHERKSASYKDSLTGFKGTGFNGVAYGASTMDEDPLISDLLDQSWTIPEPSEEVKKLMSVYPTMPLTDDEFNEICTPWNNALVITILGARIQLFKLKEMLARIWRFSEFELIDLPNNYHVVRFTNEETWRIHYKRILLEGPWVVAQHSVLVQRWSPYFDPFHNPLGRIASWIRIPNIPLQYYTNKYISRLGDMVGRTLKVDMHMLNQTDANQGQVARGRYARLCVELDLQKKLIPRIILASKVYNVEYEGLGLICFDCGRYGHRKENCPWKASSSRPAEEKNDHTKTTKAPLRSPEPKNPIEGEEFGPWMLVQKPSKARLSRKESNLAEGLTTGKISKADRQLTAKTYTSRYRVLVDWREDKQMTDMGKPKTRAKSNQDEKLEKTLAVYEGEREGQWMEEQISEAGKSSKRGPTRGGKSTYVAKGKENVNSLALENNKTGSLVNEAHTVMGKNKDRPTNTKSPKPLGHRVHRVVEGSMNGGQSMPETPLKNPGIEGNPNEQEGDNIAMEVDKSREKTKGEAKETQMEGTNVGNSKELWTRDHEDLPKSNQRAKPKSKMGTQSPMEDVPPDK